MTGSGWVMLVVLGVMIAISTPLLGKYMYRVYATDTAPGDFFFLPIERFIYRVCGINEESEQRWNVYTYSLLAFSLFGVLLTYAVLRFQPHLPLNPDAMKAVGPALSFNPSISFLTNTNWQAYSGELTL